MCVTAARTRTAIATVVVLDGRTGFARRLDHLADGSVTHVRVEVGSVDA